jgi:hypothetical protein
MDLARLTHRYPALFLNHDNYERHVWAVRLLGRTTPGETVVDVGGERWLARFALGLSVRDVNVTGPDALDGGTASLPDRSFDYAVSLDTLEHIPRDGRAAHLRELLRLARRRVVFCAPIGSPRQVQFQEALLAAGTLDPASLAFVREHLAHGLPTPEEVAAMLPGVTVRWFYAGGLGVYAVPRTPPASRLGRALLLAVGLALNALFNVLWVPFKVGGSPRPTTNRFYGVIETGV